MKNEAGMKRLMMAFGLAALLAGCATPMPTQEQITAADCGPTPASAQDAIKHWFDTALKDSDSARLRFGEPKKGVVRDAPIEGGKLHWGWIVQVQVNAKNSYGGYTGFQDYSFFFRDGRMTGVKRPPYGIWTLQKS